MPSQADLDWENVVSKNSQNARRESNLNKKEGGIFDVETGYYDPPEPNPQTGKRNLQDDGIDGVDRDRALANDAESGGGVPSGYAEALRDYVADDNTAQQEYYLTKAV